MSITHEQKVEKFYTHGTKERCHQEGGFLSFGYWTNKEINYHQAVESLIDHILETETTQNNGKILNVACGYGSETFKIYNKIKPESIIGIDITESHIAYAKTQVVKNGLEGKVTFEKQNACALPYAPKTFSYIIGIEGPAHFNTRKKFLQDAFKMLDDKGVLLISDITVNQKEMKKSRFNSIIGRFCAKQWYMPKDNWMSNKEIIEMIQQIGFKIEIFESAGSKVFPGFARFNLKLSSIWNAFRVRGIRIGLGLTIISWSLGLVYRKNLIDYAFIKATKPFKPNILSFNNQSKYQGI
jgi:cyclopropane fatty-acyl-phospholipid synthase-like methyltransferase